MSLQIQAACSLEVFPYHGVEEIGWPWFQWREDYGQAVTVYADSKWVLILGGLTTTDKIPGPWIEEPVPEDWPSYMFLFI